MTRLTGELVWSLPLLGALQAKAFSVGANGGDRLPPVRQGDCCGVGVGVASGPSPPNTCAPRKPISAGAGSPPAPAGQIHHGCPSSAARGPARRRRPAAVPIRRHGHRRRARRRSARRTAARRRRAAAPATPAAAAMAAAAAGSFCQTRSASANAPASGKRLAGSRSRARITIADRPLGTGHERRRRRVLVQPLERHAGRGVALERAPAGQHLVQHDAQRVDVGLAGHLVAARLLGAEVVDRSQRGAGDRHGGLAHGAGDAEVGHLHVPGR